MSRDFESKACKACAAAKRRCGKQKPRCRRCFTRGVECMYPPSKPARFVLFDENESPASVEHSPSSRNTQPQLNSGHGPISADSELLGLYSPTFQMGLSDAPPSTPWFTSPETWTIHHFPPAQQRAFSNAELKRYMGLINHWLVQWIETGSNPFIHAQMYRSRFPRCIQDAYSALISYLHKTSSNEEFVLRIMGDRAQQLLRDNNVSGTDRSPANLSSVSPPLDPLEHLARVQALLLYQYVGFHDGDIRLRHLAEHHMPVLDCWMVQMVEAARDEFCLGTCVISSPSALNAHDLTFSDIAHYENLAWYSWLLAESIRRTYAIVSGVQALYLTMQHGKTPPCKGSMVFTPRRGVWEARSGPAWEKLCSEVNVGLIRMQEADQLFAKVSSGEVDDFAMFILDVGFGSEMIERWGALPEVS